MKINIHLLLLATFLLAFSNKSIAQEPTNDYTVDSLYSTLTDQISSSNYLGIIETTQAIEPLLKEWTASLELIKMNAYYELYDPNKPNSTYFVSLMNSATLIINSTENKKIEKLPLYFEYYEKAFNILTALKYFDQRNQWLTNPNYIQAAKLYNAQKMEAAFQSFLSIADDNPAAMLMVGNMYEKGLGITKNEKQALSFFKKSFIAGNFDAGYHIGFLYANGLGTDKNFVSAFTWCLIAAENNYKPAIIQITEMYAKGLGTSKNIDLANEWKNKLEKSWNAYNF